jgi:hypothetical protein
MMTNFSFFQQKALDLGASCEAFTLGKFCELDWPSFDVGWPAEGNFDLPIAYQVERVIMGWPGHPDQIPFILTWIEILSEKTSWLQKCIKRGTGCSKVLLSTKASKQSSSACQDKKFVLWDASPDGDFSSLPPYPRTNLQKSKLSLESAAH